MTAALDSVTSAHRARAHQDILGTATLGTATLGTAVMAIQYSHLIESCDRMYSAVLTTNQKISERQ